MILHASAPKSMWGEAACYAAQIFNRKPTKAVPDFPNPISAWRGVALIEAYLSLRVWGCRALFYDHRQEVKKLDPKTIEGVLVGIDTEKKAWRIYYENQVVCRRDVTFVEDQFPFAQRRNNDSILLQIDGEYISRRAQAPAEGDVFQTDSLSANIPKPVDYDNNQDAGRSVVRRSSRPWKPSEQALDNLAMSACEDEERSSRLVMAAAEVDRRVPKTYKEAIKSEDAKLWEEAMEAEVLSHISNCTVRPCALPEGRKAVPFGWVYKIKTNPDGTLRYKARIIMKGYLQREGVDYKETFAPVAKWTTIRTVLALATIFDWNLSHLDFETAFMVPQMDAEVYIRVTEGMGALAPDGIAKMLKGVNGCKQGSKLFHDEVKGALLSCGFRMSMFDSCIFIRGEEGHICIVVVWVDDLLIAYDGGKYYDQLVIYLKKYKHKIFIEPTLFLGVRLNRDRRNRTMQITQEEYFDNMLTHFGMDKCNPVDTPMQHAKFYAKSEVVSKEEVKYMQDKPYRSLACTLLYPSNITRPDITYACNTASRHLQNPGKDHWELLKRIVRYLKGTKQLGLNYNDQSIEVTGWPDASWADNVDDRKSTGGYCLFIGNCLVSWSSKKQSFIALSSNKRRAWCLGRSVQRS